MDDLIAFVTARLDEDEDACRHLAGQWGDVLNSARVLREVEAKRAMVEKYKLGRRLWNPDTEEWFSPAAALFGSDMEWLIRTLAVIWNDHPDYRAEWKPDREGVPDGAA